MKLKKLVAITLSAVMCMAALTGCGGKSDSAKKTAKVIEVDLTDEQYDILQSLVDEAYDQFAGIVSEGRGIDIATVKKIADGRIYSAKQAKEKKLVDEIGTEDELKALIQKENNLSDDVVYDTAKSSGSNFLSNLMGSVQKIMPKSDSELAVDIIENKGKGVLMYYAD